MMIPCWTPERDAFERASVALSRPFRHRRLCQAGHRRAVCAFVDDGRIGAAFIVSAARNERHTALDLSDSEEHLLGTGPEWNRPGAEQETVS
jgi:hypothetical protein